MIEKVGIRVYRYFYKILSIVVTWNSRFGQIRGSWSI
jgi:hypothetical protein